MNYLSIEFPVSQKQYNKIEKQNNININVFGYEEKQPFPIYVSKEKFEDQMNLLLTTKGEKKHYVLIKICTIEQNTKKGNTFACIVFSVLVLKEY